MTTESTRTAGITAWLTADGIDFLTRTEKASIRDSVPYVHLGGCEVAGRVAEVSLGDNVINFSTEKLELVLKPYTSAKGETYYWSAFEPVTAKPNISFDEAKKLATKKPPAKRARKVA